MSFRAVRFVGGKVRALRLSILLGLACASATALAAPLQALSEAAPLTATLSSASADPVITSFTVTADFGLPALGFTTSSLVVTNARIANLRLSRLPAIAAGSTHCLALRSDGTVEAWGSNESGQCDVPADLGPVAGVAAGYAHSVAVKADGTVAAWGSNASKQCNTPAGLRGVVAIVAGTAHSLALCADGTVVGWGDNLYRQCETPKNLTGVVAIAAYGYRSMAVLANGALVQWGRNLSMDDYYLKDLVAVAPESNQTLGLKADGTLVAHGYASGYTPPADLKNVAAIAAADYHSLALRTDGSVVAWPASGLMGQAEMAAIPEGLAKVTAIAAGGDFNMALCANGAVAVWGRRTNGNVYGQLNLPAGLTARMPAVARCTFNVVPLAPGAVTVQIPGGKLASAAGRANLASNVLRRNMVAPGALQVQISPSAAVAAGAKWRRVGTTAWRDSGATESGLAPGSYAIELQDIAPTGWSKPANLSAVVQSGATRNLTATYAAPPLTATLTSAVSDPTTSALTVTATFSKPVLGLTPGMLTVANGAISNLAGDPQTRLAGAAGSAYARYTFKLTPAAVGLASVSLGAGRVLSQGGVPNQASNVLQYTFAVPGMLTVNLAPAKAVANGARWRRIGSAAWQASGATEKHYLPGNTAIEFKDIHLIGFNRPTSATVTLQSGATKTYSATYPAAPLTVKFASLPLRASMTSLTVTAEFSHPVSGFTAAKLTATNARISNLHGLTPQSSIALGWKHALAVRANGTVAAWGVNDSGQCNAPAGLEGVVAVAAGDFHSLALCADGTVAAWGNNGCGQCNVPAGLRDVVAIAAAAYYNLALRADGTVVGWGTGAYGSSIYAPAWLNNAVAIAAGKEYCLALRADGSVVSWKANWEETDLKIMTDLGHVVGIAAGKRHFLALRSDGTVAAWAAPGYTPSSGELKAPAGLSDVVAVAASEDYSLALRADGKVSHWGFWGMAPPAELQNVTALVVGSYANLALKSDGSLALWGDTQWGALPSGLVARQPYFSRYSFLLAPLANGLVSVKALAGAGVSLGGVPSQASGTLQGAMSLPGALQVTLDPAGAVAAGAQWRRVGTAAWRDSATSEPGIVPGAYAVELKDIALMGWNRPTTLSATLQGGAMTKLNAHYEAAPLTVTLASAAPDPVAGTIPVTASFSHPIYGVSADKFAPVNAAVSRPLGMSPLASISTEYDHALVLRPNGVMDVTDNYGLVESPSGLTDIVAVAAGYWDNLALRADGTVIMVGNTSPEVQPPAGLKAVAIAACQRYFMALKADGTVVVWGFTPYHQDQVPAGLSGVVAIAAGDRHCLALRADGTVAAWGDNADGQCNVPAGLNNVAAIDAGRFQNLALRTDGTVAAWGASTKGLASVPPGIKDAVAVNASYYHSFVVRADGSLVAWGTDSGYEFPIPEGLTGVTAVAGGENFAVILRADGQVLFVDNIIRSHMVSPAPARQTVFSRFAFTLTPLAPGAMSVQLPAGGASSLGGIPSQASNVLARTALATGALKVNLGPAGAAASGARWRRVGEPDWRPSGDYETGLYPKSYDIEFRDLSLGGYPPPPTQSALVQGGTTATLTVNYDSRVTATLTSLASDPVITSFTAIAAFSSPVRGMAPQSLVATNATALNFQPIAALAPIVSGSYHCAALRQDGTVAAWGNNGSGQSSLPAGLTNVVALAAGDDHTLALRADGTVAAWGYNYYGSCDVPPGLTGVTAIAAGGNHSLALRADGTVAAWGYNGTGQSSVPQGLRNVVAIAAGRWHSLALKADGTVALWGGSVQPPAGLRDVVAIEGGKDFSLALRADGKVIAWGDNYAGRCNVPANLSGVVAIAAGGSHSLALRADGTVVAWGSNSNGQSAVPAALNQVAAIAAGSDHSLALRRDGSLVYWGISGYDLPARPTEATFQMPAYMSYRFDLAPLALGPVTARVSAGAATGISGASTDASNLLERNRVVPGALKVAITPPEAVTAGAQWRVAGSGAWLASGATAANLPPGPCAVEFKPVTSWNAPTSRTLAVLGSQTVTTSAAYVRQTGSVTVTITPPEAIAAGAKWRRVGDAAWRDSGSILADIPTGYCQIEFQAIPDWTTSSGSLTVKADQVTTLTRAYTRQTGTLLVALSPTHAVSGGARWRYSGSTTWRSTGVRTTLPTGTYTIEFSELPDWGDPAPRQVTIRNGQAAQLSAAYTPELRLTLESPAVVVARPGEAATLRAVATGSPYLRYQWLKNGVPIDGATSGSLTLAASQKADEGWYSCIAGNSFLSATTGEVQLAVSKAGPVVMYLLGISQATPEMDMNHDGEVGVADVISGLSAPR